MVQGWLCSHLWEHYQFTQDEAFLKNEAYPLMKGAAEFFADWLIDDGNGHLVTPVGVSPENRFITEDGQTAAMSMGPTMDMAIIRETFTRTIAASEMFNLDESFRNELKDKLARLLPYQIGKRGQLQEWIYDFKEWNLNTAISPTCTVSIRATRSHRTKHRNCSMQSAKHSN